MRGDTTEVKGQPIIFGMTRECLAKAKKAAKEGRQYDEIRYSFAGASYLLWDLIFLPLEVTGVLFEKGSKWLK